MNDIDLVLESNLKSLSKTIWELGFEIESISARTNLKEIDSDYLWKPIKIKKGKFKIVIKNL